VIVMSGGGTIESAEDVLRLGAVAYLLKPFNFQEVLTLIADVLKAKDAESA
jgi:DNA-binding NtrC family response regulator